MLLLCSADSGEGPVVHPPCSVAVGTRCLVSFGGRVVIKLLETGTLVLLFSFRGITKLGHFKCQLIIYTINGVFY